MKPANNFDSQFNLDREYYLKKLDFLDWYRYFFAIREVIRFQPRAILEIGTGSEIVKNCLQPIIERYQVMDVNAKLKPHILADVREFRTELKESFDCAIACDVLEHIPFSNLAAACSNVFAYLVPGGKAIITIPHRRSHFLLMTPLQEKPCVITVPTGFLSAGAFYRRFIKRKIWIDPNHQWEIGDGHIKKFHVESTFRKAGFTIERYEKLLYVDFWLLNKI